MNKTVEVTKPQGLEYKYIKIPVDEIYEVLNTNVAKELHKAYEVIDTLERREAKLSAKVFELEKKLEKYQDLETVVARSPYRV